MSATYSLEQSLASLDAGGWHAAHLMRMLPQLRARLPWSPFEAQQRWIGAMEANWERIGAHRDDGAYDLAFGLGVLAAEIRHWQAAQACFSASLEQRGAHHATCFNLAATSSQRGRYVDAMDYLRRAIALAPDRAHYRIEYDRLEAWCGANPGLTPFAAAGAQIGATLLGTHHAAALHARQDDATLRSLARLEPCNDVDAARDWIAQRAASPAHTTLALIHREHGLIGVLALTREADDTATFYYWIGRSFQGQGYGSAALGLLKSLAARSGIRHLTSSVYAHNVRSIRAMHRAGFRQIPDAWDLVGHERLPRFRASIQDEGQRHPMEASC